MLLSRGGGSYDNLRKNFLVEIPQLRKTLNFAYICIFMIYISKGFHRISGLILFEGKR